MNYWWGGCGGGGVGGCGGYIGFVGVARVEKVVGVRTLFSGGTCIGGACCGDRYWGGVKELMEVMTVVDFAEVVSWEKH